MIKAVLFDLYGTLLTHPRQPDTYYRFLKHLGVADLRSAVTSAMSTDLPALSDLCQHLDVPVPADIGDWDAALHQEIESIAPFGDVQPAMQSLGNVGVRIGVISNLASAYKSPLMRLPLCESLQAPVFSCDCGMLKPDARIYEFALDRLGVLASETVMVGDSMRCDVEGPIAAGMAAIHLARDGRSNAGVKIQSLEQVVDHVIQS